MKKQILNRLFSTVASLALLTNSIVYPFSVAYAQEEITPTPEPTPVVEETTIPIPTVEPTIEPTPEETATPLQETSGQASSEPTIIATEQPLLTETPIASLEPSAEAGTSTPTVTPEQPQENGHLEAVILTETKAASIAEFDLSYREDGSATIQTDKLDYAPTDTVLITGTGFIPNKEYSLEITSETGNFKFSDRVTSDESGNLFYSYQLDGTYRPNYLVEAKDGNGVIVTSVTFTDAASGFNSPAATGGNHNQWSNPSNAFSSDNSYATETTEGQNQSYENFGFAVIPSGSTINGIEIQVEAKSSDPSGCQIEPRLWSDSDNDHSDRKTQALTDIDSPYTLGSPSDLWGATWIFSDFTNTNFHIEVQFDDISSSSCDSSTVSLDHIQTKVYYTPFVNTPPTITEGDSVNVTMSKNGSPIPFSLTLNATDPNAGQTLTWSISSVAGHGTATASGTGTSKSIGYTPTTNYVGGDSFIVQVSDGSGTDTITVNVTVQDSNVANPSLSNCCGMDVVLILDSSDSMSSGDITTVKSAATTLVNALMPATPTRIGVIDFDTTVIGTSLNPTTNKTDVLNKVNSIGHTGATEYTNWDAALNAADNMVGSGALVVIITDGNPTTSDGPLSDLNDAIVHANAIKTSGTRILAIGINSSGTGGGLTIANLVAISGSVQSPPNPVTIGTDVVTGDISGLATILTSLTTAMCGGTVTVTKLIDDDGNLGTTNDRTPASGWTFNVGGQSGKVTDVNGQTPAVTLTPASGYSVTETSQNGYGLLSASCTGATNNGSVSGNSITGIQIGNTDIVSCTFINTEEERKIDWCHCEPNGNCQSLNLPPSALQNAGHMDANGNPLHAGDHAGQCISTGTLIVKKIVSGVSPSNFYFRIEGGGTTIAKYFDADGQNDETVPSGTYNVTEDTASTPNYTPSYDNCNGVVVMDGGSATCTISNTRNQGQITFIKNVTVGTESPNSWTFNVYQGAVLVGTYNHDQIVALDTGFYTVVENGPSSYFLDSIGGTACVESQVSPGIANLTVSENGGTCIFGNSQKGSITITKDVIPNDSSIWDFTVSGPSGTYVHNDLGNDQSHTFTDLLPGSYNITESTSPHYSTNIVCNDVPGFPGSNGYLLALQPGQNAQCLVTNTYVPYCGDNIKNGEEQCDGIDGVTSGQNFCSTSCHLVPIYDGQHSCPAGTVKSQSPVWSGNISGTDPDGENFSLTSGGKYLFEASGTFVPTSAPGYLSDAGYMTINGILSPLYGIHGIGNDYAAHALLANLGSGVGVVDWGTYNPVHLYAKYYEPTTNNVQFVIGDRYGDWFSTAWQNQTGMNDNSGSLNLNVYECVNYGSVALGKCNDINGDGGECDGSEPMLAGWTLFLDENGNNILDGEERSGITNSEGMVYFTNVLPRNYGLCEVEQGGWSRTKPSNSNCLDVNLAPGGGLAFYFANQEELPGISITKSNDKAGGVGQGDTVTYSLTLKNTGNMPLSDIVVKDVPAGGFTYVAGSTVIDGAVSPDPTISGGTLSWIIKSLGIGGELVITYKILTPSDLMVGTYTNYATCNAWMMRGVLDLTGPVIDGIGGGDVVCSPASSTVSRGAGFSYGGNLIPRVLGAATELPATGNPTWILLLALGLLGTGLFLRGFSLKKGINKNAKN